MGPLFDSYIIVDWGASSAPKSGNNSIWYCEVGRVARSPAPSNPRTRESAYRELVSLLLRNVRLGRRTLVGMDFPYGYPSGWAMSLGLSGKEWAAVWRDLRGRVRDEVDNENNRFEAAAELNLLASKANAPFWGRPETAASSGISKRRPWKGAVLGLTEYRLTERRKKGAQSPWKLFGAGSVGSQSLLGIPRLFGLRWHPALRRCSTVWPFETGLRFPISFLQIAPLVVHVEIYPSVLVADLRLHSVKDAAQVISLARYFRDQDAKGRLLRFFTPHGLSSLERRQVVCEEGWMLGVM